MIARKTYPAAIPAVIVGEVSGKQPMMRSAVIVHDVPANNR